ncbi:uncharacterized oxidoreductase YtbE-like [Plodia interpunctella]|uniref:uncharacterized oxidoreductase YtbE-like n=1 Tax=Plodia interpunctella TaxID=58824 RepID=UPI00236809BB|nr:uncharacterized oxidoreductase YtbE-like [Plodia interpunctella]XP_053624496.1 uncharacterized oxidoreductase YtbE-like [Plodia interpunctella]
MASTEATPAHTGKFILNNGKVMPAIGLGTFRIRNGDVVMKVMDWALNAGYRMFDTAAVYGNESHLKIALKTLLPKYGLEREDIFITTKLSPSDHGTKEIVEHAYKKSLENLGLDYVDLYLIHFPGTAGIPSNHINNKHIRNETWKALAELYKEGRIKAIGVSNFTVVHLEQLMANNYGVIPAVNQVEWHPYYQPQDVLIYCKKNNILLQAYCSFGGTSSVNMSMMQDPGVNKIAKTLNVSCAQVLLAWALQQGIAVIPKSTSQARINENISINFTIPNEDMKVLNALGSRKIKYAWDPTEVA